MRLTYTAVLLPDSDGGYVVEVPALPGCVTYGKTLAEALLMAEDAIGGYLAVLQEDGDPLPLAWTRTEGPPPATAAV
jgi:predicted RNase H-like HicB family nuclease